MNEEKRLDLAFWPGTPAGEILKLGRVADRAGVDSLWITESTLAPGRDAVTLLGALSSVTSRVKLATGVINIFTRTPVLIASTAASLDELSNRRAILGLGTGHQDPVTRWHGVKFEKPLTRMREYVNIVRMILSGETVTSHGETVNVEEFKIATSQTRQVPVYIAAVGPRMARLAGEIADGVLITLNTTPQMSRLIDAARAAARDRGRTIDAAAYSLSFLSENQDENNRTAKRILAAYCAAPFYNKAFVDAGFVRESRDISRLFQANEKEKAYEQVTDDMIANYAAIGSDQVLERVEEHRKAGVTLPIVSLAHTDGLEKRVSGLLEELST